MQAFLNPLSVIAVRAKYHKQVAMFGDMQKQI